MDWKKANSAIKEKKEAESARASTKDRILLVDDEKENLSVLSELLREDYDLVIAESGAEALEKLKQEQVICIVTDQKMPGMTGIQLIQEMNKQKHPAIKIILTGYAELGIVVEAINEAGVFLYLTKPIDENLLKLSLKQAVSKFRSLESNEKLIKMVTGLMQQNSQMSVMLSETAGADGSAAQKSIKIKGPQKKEIGVLFTDLRDFTRISEKLTPVQVIDTLQEVYKNIHNIIIEEGGIIDKHMGDRLMAVFGLYSDFDSAKAMHCAQRIVEEFPAIAESTKAQLQQPLRLAVGIASGEVVIGELGTDIRSEHAIIGQAANLASRLQELTKAALETGQNGDNFGEFKNAMGISLPCLCKNEQCKFKKIKLTGKKIRGFEEIEEVCVFSS